MAKSAIISCLFILVIATQVKSQFFDFFSDLRPFTYQTLKPLSFQEVTTKKSKITYQRNNDDQTKPIYTENRDGNRQNAQEKMRRKTTTTPSYEYDVQYFTTQKSKRLKNNTNNDHRNSNLENNNSYYDNNNGRNNDNNGRNYDNNNYDYNNRRPWQDANVIDYTVRPETTKTYKYTTYNPLYNRPGVRPALVDSNRPPITNKPPTHRPLAVYPRPTDSSVIRFPETEDTSPPVLTGPDEDTMTPAQKRRYDQAAERMCDKYKSLSVKKVEAIPLLPSPESVQINVTQCEVSSVPLVVGGKVTSIREFPHMALLGWTRREGGGYSWKCGGSLVSDRYVLTAAHCSFQNRDIDVVSGAPRVVQLGSTYLDDTGALVVKVTSVIRHPKYTQSSSYYDLALVKLGTPVSFSSVVKPACLGGSPTVGDMVVATGWGRTEFGGDQSLELRSVSVPVWDIQDCRQVLGATRKMPQGPSAESQICAGERKGGKDTCQGDSGGPAQIQDGCLWRIVAVTSVGRSCGAINTPAVYAKVFKTFIAAQVFGDQVNNNDNQDYSSNSNDYGSNNRHSDSDSYHSGSNNQNSGSNNRRDSNNRQTYDTQNFGSGFDSSSQNYGSDYNSNKKDDNANDYSNNNRQNQQSNVYNNANKQTVINYNTNRNPQDSNTYNNYDNQNRNKQSATNYYSNNQNDRNNNYESSHNNGMVNFDSQNKYNTYKPSTSSYYGNNNRQNNNNYKQKEDYRTSQVSEDIIYWPEDK